MTTKIASLSKCGTWRWMLARIWDDARPLLVYILLNPSTADDERDDPTVKRCVRFAELLGYGGIVIVNLYAFRSSNPLEVAANAELLGFDRDPLDHAVGPDNDRWIADVAGGKLWPGRGRRVIAAWGATFGGERNPKPWHVRRVAQVRALLEDLGVELWCLDVTAAGDPKHPHARGAHRIPDDVEPVRWPIGEPPLDRALLEDRS